MNKNNPHIQKATFWASFGSMLEYYDFVIYAMMANYLSVVFFKDANDSIRVLQTFIIFAVGYFARPLGGLLFGMIGDLYGRKKAFVWLTALMSFSTLTIGFLPSFQAIGVLSPFLLAICRIIQGLSFGGELAGATTIVLEFSSNKRQGLLSSFVIASTSLGAIAASFVLYVLTAFIAEDHIISWGWRIPFILGGIAGLFLIIGRAKLEETPLYQSEIALAFRQNPIIDLVKNHTPTLLKATFLTTFFAGMIIVNLYFPYYISSSFGYVNQDIYLCTTASLVFSAIILPFCGKLSDIYDKKQILTITCTLYFIFSNLLFSLLYLKILFVLILFLFIHQLFIALFASVYFPLVNNLFPTQVRYTGIALSYNIMFSLMALLPSFLTWMKNYNTSPLIVPIVLSFFAMISAISVYFFKQK